MKIKFKEENSELNDLRTGDTIKAKCDGYTFVFLIVEAWSSINQYALFGLYSNRPGIRMLYLTKGIRAIDQEDFTETIPELIKNLKEQGFTDIEKAEFTLVED